MHDRKLEEPVETIMPFKTTSKKLEILIDQMWKATTVQEGLSIAREINKSIANAKQEGIILDPRYLTNIHAYLGAYFTQGIKYW